ncbi:MAG TPA: folate-binding protein, partial [Methylobacter sp.]
MNLNWKNFLISKNAVFDNDDNLVFPSSEHDSDKLIYPVTYLGVLTVSGVDAAKFLQGQITCNINDITAIKSSLGAMCNPKGRVITTFLLIKNGDDFLMVLPKELLAAVKKRLQMYVLRSKLTLTDSSDKLCLIGLCDQAQQSGGVAEQRFATSNQGNIVVDFQNRSLVVAEANNAQALWEEQVKLGFQPEGSAQWRYLDLLSGIPWLTVETSEEFIPQMLNLDKLGGISLTKGCYTGQEIVARTHYLGKAKREMFLAECDVLSPPGPNTAIIDDSTGAEQSLGKVLYAQKKQDACKMLVVLQNDVDADAYNLKLKNHNQ